MMAASARMSGTRAPLSSSLNRGCWASANCRACVAARARALDLAAEVERFLSVRRLGVVRLAEVLADLLVDLRVVAADDSTGAPTAKTVVSRQISRAVLKSRARITGNPLSNSLLPNVSAFYQTNCK